MRLDLGPGVRQGALEDLADGGVMAAVGALARDLKRLNDRGV